MNKITLFFKGILVIVILIIPSTLSAQVGIGLTNPTAQLTVNEDAIFNESGGDHDFRIETDTQANMLFVDADTNRIGFNTNTPLYTMQAVNFGNIGAAPLFESTNNGIDGVALAGYNSDATNGFNAVEGVTEGFNSGVFGLHIPVAGGGFGGYFATNSPAAAWAGYFVGDVFSTTGFFVPSDIKFKKDISPLNGSLEKIMQLNPKSYYFKTDEFPGLAIKKDKKHFGFIAQELDQVFPEIVSKDKLISDPKNNVEIKQEIDNKGGYYLVNYTSLIPVLTKAIQEQQVIIEDQNSKIETLENKLQLLEDKVNQLLENQD